MSHSTIWYELQMQDWPITNQPAETVIWLVGSNEGVKNVLSEASLGKEVTVSVIAGAHGKSRLLSQIWEIVLL